MHGALRSIERGAEIGDAEAAGTIAESVQNAQGFDEGFYGTVTIAGVAPWFGWHKNGFPQIDAAKARTL
jgi:hypothetical protein